MKLTSPLRTGFLLFFAAISSPALGSDVISMPHQEITMPLYLLGKDVHKIIIGHYLNSYENFKERTDAALALIKDHEKERSKDAAHPTGTAYRLSEWVTTVLEQVHLSFQGIYPKLTIASALSTSSPMLNLLINTYLPNLQADVIASAQALASLATENMADAQDELEEAAAKEEPKSLILEKTLHEALYETIHEAMEAAAQSGSVGAVRNLIKYGGDPSKINAETDRTLLMTAAANDRGEMVNFLLSKEVVEQILKGEEDKKITRRYDGRITSPLELAAHKLEEAKKHFRDVVDRLGKTALLIATELNNLIAATALLEHGANPDCADHNPETPFSQGAQGWTPVYAAVHESNPIMLKLLLEHSQDPNIPRNMRGGETPLQAAILSNGQIEAMLNEQELFNGSEAREEVQKTLRDNSITMVKLLLEHKNIDVNSYGANGETALHKAVRHAEFDATVTSLLSQAGADWHKPRHVEQCAPQVNMFCDDPSYDKVACLQRKTEFDLRTPMDIQEGRVA